ncbi:MAG: ABC transporter ATP-binding protein/permease [Chloroflexi bacterium]|nr:ABC transporter ATP-binding protein/permease [Chloroflexota bacterium]
MGMKWSGGGGGGWHHAHVTEEVQLQASPWVLLRRMAAFAHEQRAFLIVSGFAVLLASAINMVPPLMTKIIVDSVIARHDESELLVIAIAMIALQVVRYGLNFLNRYAIALASQQVIYRLGKDLYERLLKLSLRFYERNGSGEIISRVTNDINVIQNSLSGGVVQAAIGLLNIVAYAAILLVLNWRLALLCFTTVPSLFAASVLTSAVLRDRYKNVQEKIASVNAVLAENITGARVSRAFAREASQTARFEQQNRENMQANLDSATVQAVASPTIQMISVLGSGLVLGFGSFLIFNGDMSIGSLVAFSSYLSAFYQPVTALINVNNMVQQAFAGAERVFQFMDAHVDVEESASAHDLEMCTGDVKLEHVWFSYNPGVPVLQDICIHAQPGEMVALVGHTGSGKTTIVNLIPRFYDAEKGAVLIDGQDIRDLKVASLRRNIAVVLQETYLFSNSLLENIRYGRLDATDEEVITAAKEAHAHEFIEALPQGYDTNAGEAGAQLSRGQRQRIALARAILADPRILILDEATSDVDTETEVLIQEAIDRLMRGRTVFVIAHRLSTIRNADRIVVLDHGEIVEQGSHQGLLARGGVYRDLYDIQFAAQEALLAAG